MTDQVKKTLSRTSRSGLWGGAIALAAMLSMSAPVSAALILAPLFTGGVNTVTDNNAELFINRGGGATTVDVGDDFIGAIEIDAINNTAIGLGTLFNELSGVFGIRVTSRVDIGGGLAVFGFGPIPDLAGVFLAATGVAIGPTPAGTFGRFWEDATPDATRDGGTFASFVAETVDGTLRLRLAIDAGDISATGLVDLADIALVAPGFGLPISFFGSPGPDVVENTFPFAILNPIGLSGNAQRPVAPEDFTIRTDSTFVLNVVPEPTTLAILGIGLLGLGLARRRRDQA